MNTSNEIIQPTVHNWRAFQDNVCTQWLRKKLSASIGFAVDETLASISTLSAEETARLAGRVDGLRAVRRLLDAKAEEVAKNAAYL